ncbi:methyltransferase domain-containing protein [Candidatus Woesearchaeota archaeon]|jgi:hypothetical protein|nr:methyltransferase domain-containing protein [Candidatus Woesearchaeota archaeon]
MKYKYYDFSSNRSITEAKKILTQRILDASSIYKQYKSEFIKRNCPVCNSSDSKNVDYFYDMYGIDECKTCSSLFVNPCPNIEALSDYYQNSLCNRQLSSVIKKRYDSDDFINDDRLVVIAESIKNIKNNTRTIKILEIGCNNGTFLSKLRQYCEQAYPDIEFELFGVDIDKTAINNSVDEKLNLFCGLAEDITKEHKDEYDLIVHFELIEHLINPRLFVKSIHNMLVKGGKMVFTTPNICGLDNQALSYNNTRYLAHSIFPPQCISMPLVQ